MGFLIAVAVIVSFVINSYYATKMSLHHHTMIEEPSIFQLDSNNDIDDAKKSDEDTDKKNVKQKNSAPVSLPLHAAAVGGEQQHMQKYVFCKGCKYRPDNSTITCAQQLALAQSKDVDPQVAMVAVMSDGYRNCSFPKTELLPLSDDDDYSAATCFEKRGLSGKWMQDVDYARRNVYPNHRPYTTTPWHIADSLFKPTPKEPFHSYNTYKWIDDHCPTSEITLDGFCQVMNKLNMPQILVIGDSISMQFRKGLEAMLGFPFASLHHGRDWLDTDKVVIPCDDVEETPSGFSVKIFMLGLKPYRDSVALHPQANQTLLEQIFRDSAPRLKDPKKLRRTMNGHAHKINVRKQWVESNPGMNRTAVVMNIGAWMNSMEQYEPSLKGLFAWLDTLTKEKIVPFFRDTIPGHPECNPIGDRDTFDWSNYPRVEPYTNYQEFVQETQLKRSRPQASDWPAHWKYQSNGTFEHFNQWTKDVIAQRPADLVKINWLNNYNSSILRRDGLIGFTDCLHHNLPGPKDGEVHMFYSALLDMAQVRVVPSKI